MVLFDHLPIWLIFLLTLGLTLLAAEIGFRLGLWHQRRQPEGEKDAAGGTLVGGLLGLLCSLLLTGVASSADGKRSLFSMVLFAIGFSAVIVLIVDLDRSQQGLLTVSQQALLDLQRQIGRPR